MANIFKPFHLIWGYVRNSFLTRFSFNLLKLSTSPGGLDPYCFMGGAKDTYDLAKRNLIQTERDGIKSIAAGQEELIKCLSEAK